MTNEIQPKKRNIEERNENEEERSSKRQHCSIVELEDDPKTLKSILQTKESEMANLKRELEQYRQCFNECGFALIDPERVKREWKELQENNAKLKNQISDLKLRESALVIRLSQREQEVIELTAQLTDLKRSLQPEIKEIRTMLLDPMINLQFQRMRDELSESEKKLKETQQELEAVQFNAQSIVGKKLLAKCRVLQEENDELGRQISEGTLNTHKIELNLLKELVTELKRNLSESHEFVLQLDNEVEVMQNRIFDLQEQVNQLKKWKEIFAEQEKELNRLQQQLKEITQDTNNEVVSSPPQQQFTIEGSDNVDQEENESRS